MKNTWTKVLHKIPPIVNETPDIRFPMIEHGELMGGQWYRIIHDDDMMYLSYVLPGGNWFDKGDRGLTAMTFRVAGEGSVSHHGPRFEYLIERHGASFRVLAHEDYTGFVMTALRSNFSESLRIFLDVLYEPAFSKKSVQDVFQRTAQQIMGNLADPEFLSSIVVREHLFQGSPYAYVTPSLTTLQTADRWQCLNQYFQTLQSANPALIYIGPQKEFEPVLESFESFHKALKGSQEEQTQRSSAFTYSPDKPKRTVIWVYRKNSVQNYILLGRKGPSMREQDRLRAVVASTLLGGGASSFLFLILREQKGYTYGAYSRVESFHRDGYWFMGTHVRSEVTYEALATFFDIVRKLTDGEFDKEHIRASQRYMCGSFQIRHQSMTNVGARCRDLHVYDLPLEYWSSYRNNILSVQKDDCIPFFQQWMMPDVFCITGDHPRFQKKPDEKAVRELLKDIVEDYDVLVLDEADVVRKLQKE